MSAPKDTVYPDTLKIRDTGIYEDSGRRVHTTAGMGYPRKEYIRADLATSEADALRAENERLREALGPLVDAARDRAADAPEWGDRETVSIWVTIGDLRRARAALKGGDA